MAWWHTCDHCGEMDHECVQETCPGEDCPMCANEACRKCGAGCWSRRTDCEHDVVERHEDPE